MKLRYGRPEDADMSPQRVAQIAQLAEGWVRDAIHPALVVLVARRGVIVLHEAYGRFGPGPDSPPLSCDAIFPMASLTKPITATAVMCLVEDGLIGLNRPFVDYIPELDVPEAPQWLNEARVADLLSHTSGMDELELNAFIEAAEKRSPDPPSAAPGQHPVTARRIRLAAVEAARGGDVILQYEL